MKPYAEIASLRTRQQLSDAAALAWVVVWCLLGRAVYRTLEHLRGAASTTEDAGADFAGRLDDVARGVGRLPAVGRELRRPFTGAADAGRSLESAGAAAGDTIHSIAIWFGIAVALLPIIWLLTRYLPRRVDWVREAAAARRFRDLGDEGLHLFALRALANRPLHELRRVSDNPAGSLERGDYRPLAALELARVGLVTRDYGSVSSRP